MAGEGRVEFIDVHTHVLPRFDDGSRGSTESIEMLRELRAQGAVGVVLTPHFYARRDEPEDFLSAREETAAHLVKRIREEAEGDLPLDLYLGAEVEYFNAMSISQSLERMCISGTRYLLCEMPFYSWTEAMINELRVIKKERGITPIIAHIERYFGLYKPSMLDGMIKDGFLIQSNAEAFLGFGRGKVLKLLSEGRIHLIGSDCHNMEKRAPNMASAFEVIEKRLGRETAERLYNRSVELLRGADSIYRGAGGRE